MFKELLRDAFEAGRKRGRDEMYGGVLKYSFEVCEPDFDKWFNEEYEDGCLEDI